MPGIYGYLARSDRALAEESPAAKLERMLAATTTPQSSDVSRYGDDSFAVASIGFGARARSNGEVSKQGGNRICLDGYLLNREEVVGELRRHSQMDGSEATDETLVGSLYEHVGDEVTKHLTGTFNLCAYSERSRSLQLISCRHGAFHLFYALTDRFLAFATQMRALVAVANISSRIDELALSDMFNFGYLGGTRTLFQDVKLLDRATVLTVGQQSSTERRYWTYEFENVGSAPDRQDLEEETAAVLREAVGRCAKRFDRIGVPLSGGLDSRTILACAPQSERPIEVFHCSWYEREERIARRLCEIKGANWKRYDPTTFDYASIIDEGFALSDGNIQAHQYWFLPVARDVSGQVDALLDGYLMDVYFGDTFLVLPSKPRYSREDKIRIINGMWRRCRPAFVRKSFLETFYRKYEEGNRESIERGLSDIHEEHLSNCIHAFSFVNRSNRYSVALPNIFRNFAEYAFPGLDPKLTALYLKIPPEYKTGAGFYRSVLCRHFPKFAAVPWAKTGRALHRGKGKIAGAAERLQLRHLGRLALLRASGRRFDTSYRGDLNRLFRTNAKFRGAYLDILDQPKTFNRGIIDGPGLQRLIRFVDDGWPVFSLLESLITVELWFRRFVDRES